MHETTRITTAADLAAPRAGRSAASFLPPQLRVAAYIRVSTDSADQENSYEVQERYFGQLLARNSLWILAGIYADYGLSGTSGEKRTGFRRLLRHCREKRIDRVVCKSISRFARNTADFIMALRILHDNQVSIFFEKENLDTADPTSDFILTTLGAIAQEESRSISGNIRWSMQKRFPRGDVRNQELYGYRYNGRIITTSSGYQYKDLEIVEQEAQVVRRIFRQVAEGKSYSKIARELNFDHIPAPESHYNKKRKKKSAQGQLNSDLEEGWTSRHISQMVHRERYAGDVLVQKTYTPDYLTHRPRPNRGEVAQYRIYNHHPAIVDRDLYDQVRLVVEMNACIYGLRGKSRRKRSFSGLLICGRCGRFCNTRNTRSRPIWYCPSSALNNGRAVCSLKWVYEEQIICMFRKAVISRFGLSPAPYPEELIRGRWLNPKEEEAVLSKAADGFVLQMRTRLEALQRSDCMEQDRSILKRQIWAAAMGNQKRRRQIDRVRCQKEVMETRKYVLEDPSISEHQIHALQRMLYQEQQRLREREEEEKELKRRLEYMEKYWEALENGYEQRETAIRWMEQLPGGKRGTAIFLKGLTDKYIKAFVLSITIESPFRYRIHWFDDTRTLVEMDTNVEDYRHSGTSCQRKKSRKRKTGK